MASVDADRHLLFGILALQNNFIDREGLLAAFNTWVADKDRSLSRILLDRGAITPEEHDLLEALAAKHLQKYGGDAEKSLAALSSLHSVRQDLEEIADPDLERSLSYIPPTAPGSRVDGTVLQSVGTPTSSGLRFRILRPLARGGLGEVYVAQDRELNREVALKEIQPPHAHDAENRSRFVMEAEITGRLEHPGIVPVYGLGHYADGRPFYAMRFIKGDSLRDAIQRFHKRNRQHQDPGDRSLEFRQLLRRFIDVCNAVGYAHSRGVLHRDLKPGNIMLGPYGETLVVDWGLAKTIGRSRSDRDIQERTLKISAQGEVTPTQMGSAMGTPQFMSPEQANGELHRLGPASDVYSLGATLYCILRGQIPFEGINAVDVLLRVQRGEFPRPRDVDRGVPPALEAICLKATAREPENRYGSCRDLAEDIEHWLADEPVRAYAEGWRARLSRWGRRHRAWTQAGIAAALLVSLVSVAAVIMVNAARQKEKLARAEADRRATQNAELALEKVQLAQRERVARSEAVQGEAEARRRLAQISFERGLTLCNVGEPTHGILWLARALADLANKPATLSDKPDVDLERAIRINLSASRSQICELRQRLDHESMIRATAFSPDGKTVLTGSEDSTARLWDAITGTPVSPPLLHQGPVSAVAFSPDGKMMMTGSRDATARLWDAVTGQPIGRPLRHQARVWAVAFSPDGKVVLTGSDDGSAQLWNEATGQPIGQRMQHLAEVWVVAFSPDGKAVLTGSNDTTAQVWDAATGQAIGPPLQHEKAVWAVAFSPDGKTVLTGSADGSAQLWEAATGQAVGPPLRHLETVWAVAFSPDGKTILTGSNDTTARLWDAATGQSIGQPMQHKERVVSVAFSPDGNSVLTGSEDTTAQLWDAVTGLPIGQPMQHSGRVASVAFSPDGKTVLTRSDQTARLWEPGAGQTMGEALQHKEPVWAVAFSPDGKTILTGSADGEARLWDAATGATIGQPLKHKQAVTAVAFSPDGKTVLTASNDATAQLWHAVSRQPIGQPLQHRGRVVAAVFSADGKTVLTGSEDAAARLWNAVTGQLIGQSLQHKGSVWAIAISPDGKTLLTGSNDKTARLWDAATSKPIGQPMQHKEAVRAVAFRPDGKVVLTGSQDKTARLWDAATGRPIGQPLRHQGAVSAVAFNHDGKAVLTGSHDKTAQLWNAATGLPLGPPLQHKEAVTVVAFSPDGKVVLTASNDAAARLWDAATSQPIGLPLQHQAWKRSVPFRPKSMPAGSLDSAGRQWDEPSDQAIGHPLNQIEEMWAVAFRPDGKAVLTGNRDYVARLWTIPTPLGQSTEAITLWAEVSTEQELDSNGAYRRLDDQDWKERRQRLQKLGGPPQR